MTAMTMPETAVDKNRDVVSRQPDIWPAENLGRTDTETESQGVQTATDCRFRLGILPSYACHHPAANSRRNDICHVIPQRLTSVLPIHLPRGAK